MASYSPIERPTVDAESIDYHREAGAAFLRSVNDALCGVLMTLGVSGRRFLDEGWGRGAIAYDVRILPFDDKGNRSRVAKTMELAIIVTALDALDIEVSYDRDGERVIHYSTEGVYITELPGLMLGLDWDGPTAINPRYSTL